MNHVTRCKNSAGPLALTAALVLLCLAAPQRAMSQQPRQPIIDPDPEVERQSFIVADGFEVNLYAADPLIAKPIQMNFDPSGRLWIASSETYPQIKPGQVADDKVLVLEDTDNDGRSDKTTIFARGLLIPTGIAPGDGGAYVANSTELLHLSDTNGDGKADKTRVVLSGFGTEDTHHILHTLRWGFDGMLYFNQSIYIHSHIETPHGVRRLGGGGIWQFRPETMELSVFIRGLVNPWGHHFDRWGQSFATDGAGGEGINYCLPGAYYFTAPDAVRILQGLNPGSPKHCGLEVVSGRHFPESWQGSLLTNDFRGNRVCRFVVADDGAGFTSREQPELIKTSYVAFRPIDIKMGPDGAVYIADWYNPIIQHGEVDFRDPRRDHTAGRIWRVTAKGRPLVPRPKLIDATNVELLDSLKAPEQFTRDQARRVLVELGRDRVRPDLTAWLAALDPKSLEYDQLRLEALWTFQAINSPEPKLLQALLDSADPRIRAAATRVVPDWKTQLTDPVALLAQRVTETNPRVRLEAVRALAEFPDLRGADSALAAVDRPVDRFLDYALWLTARQLAPTWLPELEANRFSFGDKTSHLVYALSALGSPAAVKPLLTLLQQGKLPAEHVENAQTLIAALGDPPSLGDLLDVVLRDGALPTPRRAGLLETLARAATQRKVIPTGDLARIGSLLSSSDEPLRAAALHAAGGWNVASLRPTIINLATSSDTSRTVRAAALASLVRLATPEDRRVIDTIADQGPSSEARALALAASLDIDPKAAAPRIADWLANLETSNVADTRIVLAPLLARRDAPSLLATALGNSQKPLNREIAKLCINEIRTSGRSAPPLLAAIEKAAGLTAMSKNLSKTDVAALLADIAQFGDPSRGEAVFRRKELACFKCHAISGAGGQVGPGLESIGASAQPDYLLDSILEPNKTVKENYHSIVVATNEGKLFTGIKVRQTDQELILRDAEDREIAIPVSSIDDQKSGASLMPAGLVDNLPRADLIDLVRFLSQLGKVGPYATSIDRVFRRWQLLDPGPAVTAALSRSATSPSPLDDPKLPWRAAYTTVAGSLPLNEWLKPPAAESAASLIAVARTQLKVSTPGIVQFQLNSTNAVSIQVDGHSIEPNANGGAVAVELSEGTHSLDLFIDLARRRQSIRCILTEYLSSPARAQVVLGK